MVSAEAGEVTDTVVSLVCAAIAMLLQFIGDPGGASAAWRMKSPAQLGQERMTFVPDCEMARVGLA